MRRLFLPAALVMAFLFVQPSLFAEVLPDLSQTIRVLIMDDQFNSVPSEAEKISLVEKTEGKLLISHKKPYSGTIEVWKSARGLYLINEVPLEEYVKSVVKAETGKDWETEALKAQAVVSRTYALNRKLRNGQMKYDLTSSVMHQVYDGDNRDEKVEEAVNSTRGEVLTYDGQLIDALFHSTCGGHTESPVDAFGKDLPYLKPVQVKCELSPLAVWARRFKPEELEEALGMKGISDIRIRSHTSTGRVKEIEIETESGATVMKATDFRRAIGWRKLPSTDFELRLEGEVFDFEGRGYGHGVGMCQWSALEMAKEGKDYKEIISVFYPGTVLVIHGNKGL